MRIVLSLLFLGLCSKCPASELRGGSGTSTVLRPRCVVEHKRRALSAEELRKAVEAVQVSIGSLAVTRPPTPFPYFGEPPTLMPLETGTIILPFHAPIESVEVNFGLRFMELWNRNYKDSRIDFEILSPQVYEELIIEIWQETMDSLKASPAKLG